MTVWKSGMVELIDLYILLRNRQDAVDETYSKFCKLLTDEMDMYLKYTDSSKQIRKKCKNHKPYWNEDLNNLWKEMSMAEKLFTKCNRSRYIKENFRQKFIQARNIFDKSLRKAERTYKNNTLSDIEDSSTNNPREFWNLISKLGPRQKRLIPQMVYDQNNELTSDINTVLENWKRDFSVLYNCPPDDGDTDDFHRNILEQKHNMEAQMEHPEYNENIDVNKVLSFEEVEFIVNRLKTNQSPGIDFIPNEVLKRHDVIYILYHMLTKCFEYGKLPSVWLKAIITPIPKSSTKDPYVPLNYRGISLLSCVCKVFTGIINKRIVDYCEMHDIFVDEQNGFRKNRACIDHVYTLTTVIRNRLAENKGTFSCFIDMQKAFDWVDRDLLFYKLLIYNIDGKTYNCIKALYDHPQSCVKINTYKTDWLPTESSVRQGDALSPTLFSLYINDLAKDLKDLNLGLPYGNEKLCILLYADDIVILAENEEELQILLNFVNNWCRKWKMKVNRDKTKVVHFRKKKCKVTDKQFHMGTDIIDICAQYKYLGIIINEYLNYEITATTLAGAAGRALGGIISKFKSFKNVGFQTFSKLYHSGVVPVMDYCAGVWGYEKLSSCSNTQNRALRYFLGVHQKAPILALEGDTGWVTTDVRRQTEMLRLWNRLIYMDDSRLTKKVFLYDYDQCKDNWCFEMKLLFDKVEQLDVFNNKRSCNIEHTQMKNINLVNDEWKNNLYTKPKLRTYVLFKENYCTENYVKYCMSRQQRSLIAQLRLGILPIHIETGRFRGTKLEDRICQLCDIQEVEDEIHFVCKCNLFKGLREIMYRTVQDKHADFYMYDNKEKFIHLAQKEWKILGNYLVEAWSERTNKLYS